MWYVLPRSVMIIRRMIPPSGIRITVNLLGRWRTFFNPLLNRTQLCLLLFIVLGAMMRRNLQ